MFYAKKILSAFIISAGFLGIIIAGVLWNSSGEVKVSAAGENNVSVHGYAWSDTVGWIQFDPSYGGVYYDTLTGQLSSYAWSDNIGWISFNNLLLDNNGAGGTAAKASTATGVFTGWARACAGTDSVKDKCDSMVSRTDGWDGWIKFDTGKLNPVTIDVSTGPTRGEFTGYAWGSDVVGWVSFNCSNEGGTFCKDKSNYKVWADLPPPLIQQPLTVTCSASPTSVRVGQLVTFNASVSGGTSPYTYTWSENGTLLTESSQSFNKSYSTTGTKSVTVKVKDSSSQEKSAICPLVTVSNVGNSSSWKWWEF